MSESSRKGDPFYQPISDEEILTIRKELRERDWILRDRETTNSKEGQKLFAQHHHASRLSAVNNSADHGKAFVKFAFLLNGGAMIALLALVGTLYGKAVDGKLPAISAFTNKLQLGFLFFIIGLVCAALLSAVAFFQWRLSAQTYFNEGQTSNAVSANNHFGGEDKDKVLADLDKYDLWNGIALISSVALGSASLFCFVAGALKAAKAFAFFSLLR